jgi:hypothetical protein
MEELTEGRGDVGTEKQIAMCYYILKDRRDVFKISKL